MIRNAVTALAVCLVLCAALLLGAGSTATVSGQTLSCAGPIVGGESGGAYVTPTDATGAALNRQCERHDQRQLILAGIAALLGVTLGALVVESKPTADGKQDLQHA